MYSSSIRSMNDEEGSFFMASVSDCVIINSLIRYSLIKQSVDY